MRKNFLFIVIGLFVVFGSFWGCATTGSFDDEDIEALDIDIASDDTDGDVETIIIDETNFSEEPS
ncbi:MAG: hypothetical protein LBV66_03195, partial [Elusimicrobiota bacterium]|nr:hypothetical protein [Elusimicrobiota bacterium]